MVTSESPFGPKIDARPVFEHDRTVLTDLLTTTSPHVLRMWRDLDLDALGEPVSWAGPDTAPVWLDCARDFTEYWVHQQQIRDATGRPNIGGQTVVHTVLDTFLRALPHTLAHREDVEGTVLTVEVDGPGGGTWTWQRSRHHWRWASDSPAATTTLTTDPDTLWRLCVRGIEPHNARQRVAVRGNAELADAVLQIVSIIR